MLSSVCYTMYATTCIHIQLQNTKYSFKINNIAIKQSTNFKFLGILIDQNRNWKMQINNIKNKLYYGLIYYIAININVILIL